MDIDATLEAILFASGEPVPGERLASILGVTGDEIDESAERLSDGYQFDKRGIRLVKVNGKYQLVSAPEYYEPIRRCLEARRPPHMTASAMEVLAIIAYRQPVTRAVIEQIRGVDSSYSVTTLIDRGLITAVGRLDVPGRPELLATTDLFLRAMSIENLDGLVKTNAAENEQFTL
ncbi:MAG: SMC-Scp complex subunit ScpB [Oscillospiraceae bacterium]|jgi:segregation and condensation protein B|nr:SMC-Scp complex subunit ScpB [Oscillospiraceae bacterium]